MRDPLLVEKARAMRNDMPDCERRLWQRLRGKQVAGHKFRRQYPIGPFIVDFASVGMRLAIEVDGDSHGNDTRERLDMERTEWLKHHGWTVIRFWTSELTGEMDPVVERIETALTAGQPSFVHR